MHSDQVLTNEHDKVELARVCQTRVKKNILETQGKTPNSETMPRIMISPPFLYASYQNQT
jgi:hypothetical protein